MINALLPFVQHVFIDAEVLQTSEGAYRPGPGSHEGVNTFTASSQVKTETRRIQKNARIKVRMGVNVILFKMSL